MSKGHQSVFFGGGERGKGREAVEGGATRPRTTTRKREEGEGEYNS